MEEVAWNAQATLQKEGFWYYSHTMSQSTTVIIWHYLNIVTLKIGIFWYSLVYDIEWRQELNFSGRVNQLSGALIASPA